MARRDARALRDEAAAAAAAGKHRRAFQCYQELERIDPGDPQWAKRAGDALRRLDKDREAVAAYDRAVDRYAESGFVVQAIAVCRLILQIDPSHSETARRLADLTEERASGRTRIDALAARQAVVDDDLPLSTGTAPIAAGAPPSAVRLQHGAPLDTVRLGRIVPGALEQMRPDGSGSGIFQIPLDDELELVPIPDDDDEDAAIEIDVSLTDLVPPPAARPAPAPPAARPAPAPPAAPAPARTSTVELSLDDLAEISELDAELEPELPSPLRWSASARRALAETPLFSALGAAALEALVSRVDLVSLDAGEVLFREGDPGETLYVVADGEVDVVHEGPPRARTARLGPGTFFGEVALVTEQPRSATIEAAAPTDLLAIDRALVSELVADHPELLVVILRFVRDRLVARLMATSPLFSPLPPDERAALAARFRFLEIDAGTVLVAEGERSPGLYILLAGRGDVRRGRELVTYLGAGHVAGATSLLTRAPSTVRVAAITRCLALLLAAADFREVIMTHPHVLEYVGELADERRAALDDGGGRLGLV